MEKGGRRRSWRSHLSDDSKGLECGNGALPEIEVYEGVDLIDVQNLVFASPDSGCSTTYSTLSP